MPLADQHGDVFDLLFGEGMSRKAHETEEGTQISPALGVRRCRSPRTSVTQGPVSSHRMRETSTHRLWKTCQFLPQVIFRSRRGWPLQLAGVGLTSHVCRPDERPRLLMFILSLVSILPFLSGGDRRRRKSYRLWRPGDADLFRRRSKVNVAWNKFQHIQGKSGASAPGAGTLSPRPFLDAPPCSTNNAA